MTDYLLGTTVSLYARLLIGGLFVFAAISKTIDRRSAVETIGKVLPLAPQLSRLAAAALVAAELVLGTLLIIGLAAPVVAILTVALLALFIAVALLAVARGVHVECHCFGPVSRGELGWGTIFRNLLLLGLAVQCSDTSTAMLDMWLRTRSFPLSWQNPQVLGIALGLAGATVLAYAITSSAITLFVRVGPRSPLG